MSNIFRLIILGSLFGAVSLGVYIAFSIPDLKPLRKQDELNDLFDFDADDQHEDVPGVIEDEVSWKERVKHERNASFVDRVVKRILLRATGWGQRFTPAGYMEHCREKLRHAGKRGPEQLDKFLAIRVITAIAGVVVGLLSVLAFNGAIGIPGLNPRMSFSFLGLIALFLLIGPDASLNRESAARRKEVQLSLPDLLDLLTISVEAGLGFEQSIQHIVDSTDGPLAEEFGRMNAEMRAGSSRSDAMRALDERIGVDEVKLFVMAMLQADKFGVSIGRVLRSQAEEMRIKRRQRAQEQAQKAPVKMLIPMTLFIFPPLFVVVLGPAIMNIATNFK